MACNRIGIGVPLCHGVVHDSCDATNPWFEVHMVDPPISEFFSMTPNNLDRSHHTIFSSNTHHLADLPCLPPQLNLLKSS
jgi:hypothetical protein